MSPILSPKFYLKHMNSIFEFSEPARFKEDLSYFDGGFFVSLATGDHIHSNGSVGLYSPERMNNLQEAAKLSQSMHQSMQADFEAEFYPGNGETVVKFEQHQQPKSKKGTKP